MNGRLPILIVFLASAFWLQAQDQLSLCLQDVNGAIIKQASVLTGGSTAVTLLQDEDCHVYEVPNSTGDILFTPEKDIEMLNGVDVFDLHLIRKQILAQTQFTDIQRYAADVNGNNGVSTYDLVLLAQRILGLSYADFTKPSWTFFNSDPSSFTFFTLPSSSISINTPIAVVDIDMFGIKTGDVDFSADPALFQGEAEQRSACDFSIILEDQVVTAGNTYMAKFVTRDFNEMVGVQLTLDFDTEALQFVSAEKAPNIELINMFFGEEEVQDGKLTNLWVGNLEASFPDDAPFFEVEFTALQDGLLSDFLEISSNITRAIAYDVNGVAYGVCLETSETVVSTEQVIPNTYTLDPCYPNPFSESTTIQFHLGETKSVSLDILDVLGRPIQSIYSGTLPAGQQQFVVSDLPEGGLYFYRLQIDEAVETRRLLYLK